MVTVNSGAICAGSSFTMTPSGANTYTYSSGSSVVTPTANASYSVTGTSAAGCVGAAAAVSSVTVNPLPTITVNSGAICSGSSFTMTPSGANTYTYSSGNAVVTPMANSSYSVTGASAAGCIGAAEAISTVTINPSPTLNIVATSYTVCPGNPTTLLASNVGTYNAITYTWTNTGTTGTSISPSPTVTTQYTVTGSGANGCISEALSTINISPLPTLSLGATSYTICAGSSTTIIASGATTYTWSNTNTTGTSISPSPIVTTQYTITGTNANGCTNKDTLTVVVQNCTTGIEQVSGINNQVIVYPNPNNGIFVIESSSTMSDARYILFDINGREVLRQTINGKATIDASSLINGVYNISIISNEGTVNKRVVITR